MLHRALQYPQQLALPHPPLRVASSSSVCSLSVAVEFSSGTEPSPSDSATKLPIKRPCLRRQGIRKNLTDHRLKPENLHRILRSLRDIPNRDIFLHKRCERLKEQTVALRSLPERELELVFTNENNKKRPGAAAWGGLGACYSLYWLEPRGTAQEPNSRFWDGCDVL